MTGLCSYKNLFGAPDTGAHSIRFMGLAVVDVALTILAGLLIAWFFEWPTLYVVGAVFLLGIFLHWLFCVRTTIDTLLFSS